MNNPVRNRLVELCVTDLTEIMHMAVHGCSQWVLDKAIAQLIYEHNISRELAHDFDFWKTSIEEHVKASTRKGLAQGIPKTEINQRCLRYMRETCTAMVNIHWLT